MEFWTTNGSNTFQKRHPSGLWTRVHPKQDGTFETRTASATYSGRPYVESGFQTIEDAMEFADAEFGD